MRRASTRRRGSSERSQSPRCWRKHQEPRCRTSGGLSAALDILAVVVPGAAALGGAYLGVDLRDRAASRDELRRLTDEATESLERANQRRGSAYVAFVRDGANTSPEGLEALNAFRAE